MDKPDRQVELYFSQPVRQIALMILVLMLVAAGVYIAFPKVAPSFLSSPYMNGSILVVFLIGVMACFWQVWQLVNSVSWIERYTRAGDTSEGSTPRLLTPLAALLRGHSQQRFISSASSRSIQDSVATRIDEARDITRYIVNLLILMGLLGTFFGLATTIPGLVRTIRDLSPVAGESSIDVFSRLINGLDAQLGGMGTAFSSSLLGLACSLVVGMLELFSSHGQNRFYRELEEWLSSFTRIGYAGDGENDGSDAGMIGQVLDHMTGQMEALQNLFTASDVSRSLIDERLGKLVTAVDTLTKNMHGGADSALVEALNRLNDGQDRVIAALEGRSDEGGGTGSDAESRMRLRSIDVQLLRILEEISAGRQESITEIRADIAALTRAMRAQAGGR